jgi:hypothetical protein
MDDPNVMSRFKKALDATLEPEASEKLLQKYALAGALNLSTDLRFHFPVMKVAEGWADKESHKCLRYHFHQVRINDILKLEFRLTI